MGEAEIADVLGELVGELEVGERTVLLGGVPTPRAQMHLVDRHGLAQWVACCAVLEPVRVAPAMRRTVDDRRVRGWDFGGERDRIGLDAETSVLRADLELVL